MPDLDDIESDIQTKSNQYGPTDVGFVERFYRDI